MTALCALGHHDACDGEDQANTIPYDNAGDWYRIRCDCPCHDTKEAAS